MEQKNNTPGKCNSNKVKIRNRPVRGFCSYIDEVLNYIPQF